MKEQLQEYIIQKLGKKPDNIDLVLNAFKPMKAKRNLVLVDVGEVCKYCFFIVNGCLKITTYNLNGEESTTNLAFEYEWRTAMHSFINQQPSNEKIVAVEESELLVVSKQNFQEFSQSISGFQQIYQQLLEESFTKSIERVQTLMSMDALGRLKWLLSEYPLIFTRLSNRLIASYLGISEATLSRLKSKL